MSGGPDSLALLLLAAAACPGRVEAATVDHDLREGSGEEANMVAAACARLGVPHDILQPAWASPPVTAIEERSREARYAALAAWMAEHSLPALATGHHRDDQAETLVMRLNRGAGVRGLAAMRPVARVPGSEALLVRPLLSWAREELAGICDAAGLRPALDSSNADTRFERARVRNALAASDWLDPDALARSATHLAAADEALDWAAAAEWDAHVSQAGEELRYRPVTAPPEIRRRVVSRAITQLGSEGGGEPLRGREVDRLLAILETGQVATLRGVRCSGSGEWRFAPAPPRRAH